MSLFPHLRKKKTFNKVFGEFSIALIFSATIFMIILLTSGARWFCCSHPDNKDRGDGEWRMACLIANEKKVEQYFCTHPKTWIECLGAIRRKCLAKTRSETKKETCLPPNRQKCQKRQFSVSANGTGSSDYGNVAWHTYRKWLT